MEIKDALSFSSDRHDIQKLGNYIIKKKKKLFAGVTEYVE